MEKMEKESNLMVTFCKRRSGLFKKASELCILCGVEIAIIVISPGKKPFSFGHPSVEMIVDRLLNQNPQPYSSTSQFLEVQRNANIYGLNTQLTYAINQLEIEKNKSKGLENIRKQSVINNWWEAPIENLELEELEKLKVGMEWLKKETEEQKQRILMANNQLLDSQPVITMTPNGFMLGYGHFSC